ncbi:hypothetical protein GA830_15890 [Mesorhizobium sp. NBSH29]|uniref:TerB family tellurite resistance protein n=1 Tax=Mesorhizobium sp. NBSH29 TaxID=2654249 RepID=UPI00189654DE|nr:TerB family tellurite resistance protein [Mesorhizobium sp. NBSH29]QPC88066.1 hypothetical protein GA830_15890 [Mesorhizobium sp. NBSH29]
MFKTLLADLRAVIEGDPGVRKVADDPAISAELLLLFRMILADGKVETSEMDVFRRICRDSFGIEESSLDAVIEYLRDFGYETNGKQAIAVFRSLEPERRKSLVLHMTEIAKADTELADQEIKILKRAFEMLEIDPQELVERSEG